MNRYLQCPDDTAVSINYFDTTNMPLQDITMDQTAAVPNGSSGNTPGIGTGGRTMKEYEDQLEALKKENFNLKLRIYFLEDRMGVTAADEDPVKKNIELKVEIESLRKEQIEKQELLTQAAKGFELMEEQKNALLSNQTKYQESLEKERARIEELEAELEMWKAKLSDTTMYYQESFGITPEEACEQQEKLHQMEEVVASLEAEVKQITASLEEERNWAHELEIERDQFRDRLDAETRLREKLSSEHANDIDGLRERIRELEEDLSKRESLVQQQKSEIAEKDRLVKEKMLLLEETCRTYEEVSAVAEKRKKQIVQLRLSVKSRDDALTDLNNKHRALLNQFEQSHSKRSSAPTSPVVSTPFPGSCSPSSGLKSPSKYGLSPFTWELHKSSSFDLPNQDAVSPDDSEIAALRKKNEEYENEKKVQEEAKKQLILKLCNVKKAAKVTEEKLKKLEIEHMKALQSIQGLMELQANNEDKVIRKDRQVKELEQKLQKIYKNMESTRTNHPERDQTDQQRFEEMESKIDELRVQIESVKAEKCLLEKKSRADSEILEEQLHEKEAKIETLETEKNAIRQELWEKIQQLDRLKEAYEQANDRIDKLEFEDVSGEQQRVREELILRNIEIEEKNRRIEQLSKDLQVKTQNLQKLVNTELWSKNKEIAKLHNQTMSVNQSQDTSRGNKSEQDEQRTNSQLTLLLRELNSIGVGVTFTSEVVQLNYVNGNEPIDVKTLTEYVQKLVNQKRELEREVDYLRWLKFVAQPDFTSNSDVENPSFTENERAKKYCEMLRTHVKDLFKFMKEMLKNTHSPSSLSDDHRNIVLDVLLSSKTLYDDFAKTQKGEVLPWEDIAGFGKSARRSQSTELMALNEPRKSNGFEAQSDSEAFSEPDRKVSLARIGLQETLKTHKSSNRPRASKYLKNFSDSEDSIDFVPHHKNSHQSETTGEIDVPQQIQQIVETNKLLSIELRILREEILPKMEDTEIVDKISSLIETLEKSKAFNERLRSSLERSLEEWREMKNDGKNNSLRKAQLEMKITDVEIMAIEIAKQKSELLNYKEDTDRKASEMMITLNRENEALRTRIKLLEEENELTRSNVSTLSKDLDQLTLSHSQVLVENTKLTNDKLRLEQELRKSENKYDTTVRCLQDKFNKEVTDLNQMNDSHRARLEELEVTNKELRRHVVVCEASDSAPSSSGVSSIPTDNGHKQTCEDLLQEYHTYNGSQYWLPINYPTSTGRSKSSCSPDLGIESDAAVSTTRPLQDTLKITESMTNLLSDEDYNSNTHRGMRDVDRDSPLHLEGLDEVEALKQENEALKRRLMKTRRALEDTFQHLSASNKNKKNVEKAITKQLMMTKSILKKTRTYEEPFD
ncbi:centrosomin isoform X2 [Venturia canescens]|uniref:centrosomin isoform X2 n=1 Tax=Venturia canescens TaxID=32260 RepID=UPI001C9C0A96|nr:centrosomin isoform X2 [Venturia canescens]